MFSGRSSSASSFTHLNDVESVFDGSIIDRSNSRNDYIEGAEINVVEKLKMSNALLKLEIMELREQKVPTDLKLFKTQLSGEWKLQSSKNVKEFLENRKGNLLDDIIFQTASKHFNFDGNLLTTHETAGINVLNQKTIELSKCEFGENGAHVTFVSNNRLKTIQLGKDEVELSREDVFISEDGRLQVILKAFGVECTRVYQNFSDNSSDTENYQEKLLKLQKEHDELKEKNAEVTTENAKLKEIQEKERKDIAKLEETLKMEQENSEQRERELEKKNNELITEVAKLKEIRGKEWKEQQPYGHLAEIFNGYWKCTSISHFDCMIRIEGNQFILQFERNNEPRFYTFGEEKVLNGLHQIVKVDGSKIRHLESFGGPIWDSTVYEVEEEQLIVSPQNAGSYKYEKVIKPSEFPPEYIRFLA